MNASTMASVDTFKSAVIRIRDILRGPGVSITGLDSMRHICLYMMARYMTRDKVGALGIPEELAWETLLDTAQTKNGGVQKAIDCFYHPDLDDCLVHHFDRLFGTDKFSFDVKSPQKHKEILEILDKVNIQHVDCHMDVLGWIYEQHLGTGSTAARDLGQFFTDRSVCEYMTELCKPGFKAVGVPESVCDPSMGTGGFLTSYIKYYKKHHATAPVDWSVQEKEIHGCDTDVKVAAVARLNMFMESGGVRHTNLLTHDSLYGDLTQTGYDIILANMPFGLKGIKHADCCDRVKDLKIRGTKTEPLFLQLMMVSLNLGGRCAVVVPDGMLVNGSLCHNETRKYLLEHFKVRRIVKMKGRFFMNTGIMPSIIFFENTGRPTTAVEFWEVEKDIKGVITESMVVSVSVEKLDASYSFDMRRYMENEKPVANPAGWPMVKLEDACYYENGKILASNEKIEVGEYNVMGGGMDYNGKTSKFNRSGETISISKSGASAGFVMYHNTNYWAGDCLTIIPKHPSTIAIKYMYYYLKLNNHLTMSRTSGSTIPHCKWDDIKHISIPIPPLPIQQEIVATLDRIYPPGTTELADTLKLTDKSMDLILANPDGATLEPIVEAQRLIRKSAQMVADVKVQMAAMMQAVANRGFPMVKLGDYVCIESGKYITKKEAVNKGFPIYGGGDACDYYSLESNRNDRMVIAKDGISLKCVRWISGYFHLNHHGWTLKCNEIILEKYLYYYLSANQKSIYDMATGSAQKGINRKKMEQFKVPLPPIAFQHSILARMDALQSQLTALENLQKQTEDNARFILESYLNCPAAPDRV